MKLRIETIQSGLFILLFAFIPLDLVLSLEVASKVIFPTKIILIILLGSTLLNIVSRDFKLYLPKRAHNLLLILLMLIIFDVIATFRGVASIGVGEIVENLFHFYLVYIFLCIVNRDFKLFLKGLKILTLVMVIGSIIVISQVYFDIFNWKEFKEARKIGDVLLTSFRSTIFPMSYGLNGILIFSGLSFSMMSIWKKGIFFRSRIISVLVSGLLIFSILFSNSRSTWLGFFILLLTLLGYFVLKKGLLRTLCPLFLIFILFFTVVNSDFFAEQYKDINSKIYRMGMSSTELRLAQYEAALHTVKTQPLFGLGHGVFFKTTGLGNIYIHNYFLRKAAETGIISGVLVVSLFMITIFRFTKGVLRNIDREMGLICLCLLSSFLGMITELLLYDGGRGLAIVWMYIALSFSDFMTASIYDAKR